MLQQLPGTRRGAFWRPPPQTAAACSLMPACQVHRDLWLPTACMCAAQCPAGACITMEKQLSLIAVRQSCDRWPLNAIAGCSEGPGLGLNIRAESWWACIKRYLSSQVPLMPGLWMPLQANLQEPKIIWGGAGEALRQFVPGAANAFLLMHCKLVKELQYAHAGSSAGAGSSFGAVHLDIQAGSGWGLGLSWSPSGAPSAPKMPAQ